MPLLDIRANIYRIRFHNVVELDVPCSCIGCRRATTTNVNETRLTIHSRSSLFPRITFGRRVRIEHITPGNRKMTFNDLASMPGGVIRRRLITPITKDKQPSTLEHRLVIQLMSQCNTLSHKIYPLIRGSGY